MCYHAALRYRWILFIYIYMCVYICVYISIYIYIYSSLSLSLSLSHVHPVRFNVILSIDIAILVILVILVIIIVVLYSLSLDLTVVYELHLCVIEHVSICIYIEFCGEWFFPGCFQHIYRDFTHAQTQSYTFAQLFSANFEHAQKACPHGADLDETCCILYCVFAETPNMTLRGPVPSKNDQNRTKTCSVKQSPKQKNKKKQIQTTHKTHIMCTTGQLYGALTHDF